MAHDTKEVSIFDSYTSLKEKVSCSFFRITLLHVLSADRALQGKWSWWNVLRLHANGRRGQQVRLWSDAVAQDDGGTVGRSRLHC